MATSELAEAKLRAAQLAESLRYHDRLYYERDASEISDAEYDQIRRGLLELEERFPELRTKSPRPGSSTLMTSAP